jgi:excisionase family DNA binding protein
MNTIRALVRQYICEALGVDESDLEGPPERPVPMVSSNGHLEPEPVPEDRLTITAQEFAARTGISLSTIYQLARTGDLKRAPHPGKRVLIPVSELDRYR